MKHLRVVFVTVVFGFGCGEGGSALGSADASAMLDTGLSTDAVRDPRGATSDAATPDAGLASECGDDVCDADEDCSNCPDDCGATWDVETVDVGVSNHSVGANYTSIAVTPSGAVHVGYVAFGGDGQSGDPRLRYAHKPADGEWSRENVVLSGSSGSHSSVGVDSSGAVHIAYLNSTGGDLKLGYATRSSPDASWTLDTVDEDGRPGAWPALTIDSADNLHVSYYNEVGYSDLKYARRPVGGEWTTETVDAEGSVGADSSIYVTVSGDRHIAYTDATGPSLRYISRPAAGSWSQSVTVQSGFAGNVLDTALVVDDDGAVHIAYGVVKAITGGVKVALRYASKQPGDAFDTQELIGDGDVASHLSMAGDRLGGLHLAYSSDDDHGLHYMHRPKGGVWSSAEFVDEPTTPAGWLGPDVAIAVDPKLRIHTVYLDLQNRALKYATRCVSSRVVK